LMQELFSKPMPTIAEDAAIECLKKSLLSMFIVFLMSNNI